ncbi:MAG TPA: HNH endonuclease [Verrucomicrobia bacterium]|nr:HNH endonuclease [Verrucomicrobiota bacterium]
MLKIYQHRCCITGLDIPEVNRASHIIGWAENEKSRMDPRNGLCLSATYDAAFDCNLISFDENYKLILSKELKQYSSSESVSEHFLKREGQMIQLPIRYRPLQDYMELHRANGEF